MAKNTLAQSIKANQALDQCGRTSSERGVK